MKLKEKLARDNCSENLDQNKNCMLCFLAGFEKARELAATEIQDMNGPTELEWKIRDLGEEKV